MLICLSIMATNSKPEETLEYRTFREHYDRLVNAIHDPVPLAARLFARSIIDSTLLQRVSIPALPPFQNTNTLLIAVLGKIQTDPSTLCTFLSVLNEDPSMQSLVESMQSKCKWGIQPFIRPVQQIFLFLALHPPKLYNNPVKDQQLYFWTASLHKINCHNSLVPRLIASPLSCRHITRQNPGLAYTNSHCQQCMNIYTAMYTYNVTAHGGIMVLSGIPGEIKRMRKQWIPGPFLRFFEWAWVRG